MSTSFYFAYGSNMNHEQMQLRCPAAIPSGMATLVDHAFRINRHGVATAVPRANANVTGGLWRVTDDCLAELDRYEGVAQGLYTRTDAEVCDADGRPVMAEIYVAAESAPGTPRDRYLTAVLAGAADFGLPVVDMEAIAAAADFVEERCQIHELIETVRRGVTYRAPLWQGAHVIVSDRPISNPDFGFSRYVLLVSTWAAELSHVFTELVRILSGLPGYGVAKRDWFAHIAEAARRAEPDATAPADVCAAALEAAARIVDGDLAAPSVVMRTTPHRKCNPFRFGTVHHAATELLFDGGHRRDLAIRLAELVPLHPWTKAPSLADYDKRLLLTASLLRRRYGYTEDREGRGIDGTIRIR